MSPAMHKLAFGLLILAASAAGAAPTPEAKCQAAKNLATGNYARCLQAAEAKLALSGVAPKYASAVAKCSSAVAGAFAKAESAAAKKGAECTATGDGVAIADA